MSAALTVAADVLVLLGLLLMALGVYGMYRMPDVYTQLHAAAKAASLGLVCLLVAAALSLDAATAARAALVAAFILFTAPVGAHSIARAANLRLEGERAPRATRGFGEIPAGSTEEAPRPDTPRSG